MSTDFIREIEEDIRRDRWKRLWDRYGLLATAAVVLLVVGVASWSVWRNLETQRAEAQTAELSRLIDRAATADAGTADAMAAFARGADPGRAALARFNEAATRAKAGDTAAAIAVWDGLARTGDLAPAWRDLATLLSVLNQIDGGDPAALDARLAALDATANAYRFSVREMRAILALRQNRPERALEIWRALTEDAETPQGVRTRAAQLVDVHGGAR
jgi:hypothetical protein